MRSIESKLGLGLLVFLIAIGFVLQTAGAPGGERPKSVTNRTPDGRRAAIALLDELGFDARAWTGGPGALPVSGGGGRGLLWLPGVPRPLGDPGEGGDSGGLVGALHDPFGYLEFVESGGALVAPATSGVVDFLELELGLDEIAGLVLTQDDSLGIAPTTFDGDGAYDVEWPLGHVFEEPPPVGSVAARMTDADGRILALELVVGRGTVLLLAGDSFLDNRVIDQADHAVFLVRIAEALARGGPILFDEYALGGWSPESAASLAVSPRFLPATAHLLLLLFLFAWRLAWVRSFPRDPEPLERASPIARARSTARLLERAQRVSLLADQLVDGALADLVRRLRIPAPPRELDGGGELAERRLEAIAMRTGLADRLESWRSEVLGRRVAGAADLEALDRSLRSIEREVLGARTQAAAPLG